MLSHATNKPRPRYAQQRPEQPAGGAGGSAVRQREGKADDEEGPAPKTDQLLTLPEPLPPRRSYTCTVNIYNLHTTKRGSGLANSPFTICRCLFSQLRGASCRRCSTTWLLCRRLVRSYQAVVIMAFSRCRLLMNCSVAALEC